MRSWGSESLSPESWDGGGSWGPADDEYWDEQPPGGAMGSLPAEGGSGGAPPWEQPGWQEPRDGERGLGPDRRHGAARDPGRRGRRAGGYGPGSYEAGGFETGDYRAGGFETGDYAAGGHEPAGRGYGPGGRGGSPYEPGWDDDSEVGADGHRMGYADDTTTSGAAVRGGGGYGSAGDRMDDPGYGGYGGYAAGGDSDGDGYQTGGYPAYGGEYEGAAGDPYTGYQDAYDEYDDSDSDLHPGPSQERGPGPGRGRGARDRGRAGGYERRGGWEDVEDDHNWEEDEYQEDFLPGLKSAAAGIRGGSRASGGGSDRARAPAARPKRKKGMRRLASWLALSLLLILLGGAGGAYYYVYRAYLHPPDYSGPGAGSVVIQIKPGQTAAAIGVVLQRAGVVESARAFANAAKASPQGSSLEPGYYRLHKHMQASLALKMLLNPSSRFVYTVAIPEGFRLSEIIARLGAQTHDLSGYQQAIKNTSALGLPSYAHGNPEGYLFPATYQVAPGTPPLKVLQQMVQRFGQEAASVNLPRWAAHDQMTQAQIIVVASLVQAEGRPSDFPKIARVIYNRLNLRMQLQLDSTVMYALHTTGIAATQRQLNAAKRSPYDTYTHYGLPPGPIDSPGDAAIRAALHPAQGNWLYFVTVNPKTGLTKFTSDFNQFSQWEAQFRAALAKGNG